MFIDGDTADGIRVTVWTDHGRERVLVDGKEIGVVGRDVLRDGGTVIYRLANGSLLTFPYRIGRPDRTPNLDGKDILVAG